MERVRQTLRESKAQPVVAVVPCDGIHIDGVRDRGNLRRPNLQRKEPCYSTCLLTRGDREYGGNRGFRIL
jgi:hypothetical protein